MRSLMRGQVHPTALISDEADLAPGVTVGAFATVGPGVQLGPRSVVGPYSILGEPVAAFYTDDAHVPRPLTFGEDTLIRSHSVFYEGSQFGPGFECGHRVTVREGTEAGSHVRIGTLSDVQGDCQIGEFVRLHSNVHIGMKSVISDYVWIFPYVVLTNDPQPPSEQLVGVTVDEFAVIATMTVVLPGVRIGRDALVGASSLVRNDVPDLAVVVGNPAKQVTTVDKIVNRETGKPVYPWRHSFDRGMPWAGTGYEGWLRQQEGLPN